MTTDHQTRLDLDALYRDLDDLLASCEGLNRHDQAIACITFCVEEGITTGPQIIGILRHKGFNNRHIGKLLHDFSGSDPVQHFWWRDETGTYHRHPSVV